MPYELPYLLTAVAGQAFTGTANSTYSWDIGATGAYLGNQAKPVVFKGKVITGFTGGDSGTRIEVITSDTSTISTADQRVVATFASPKTTYSATPLLNGVIPTTSLLIGKEIFAVIPPNIPCLRYLAISVTPANEALATGLIQFSMQDGVGEAGAGCVA